MKRNPGAVLTWFEVKRYVSHKWTVGADAPEVACVKLIRGLQLHVPKIAYAVYSGADNSRPCGSHCCHHSSYQA